MIQRVTAWTDIRFEHRDYHLLDFDGPALIVANHQSAIDFLGVYRSPPPGLVPIVKGESRYYGPFGLICRALGAVFVNRLDPEQSHAAINAAADSVLDRKAKVLCFAEGTRCHNGVSLLPFKKGGFHLAVRAQIPVIPLVFSSYRNFYSKPQRKFNTGGTVIVQALPPIPTLGLCPSDVDALAKRSQGIMATAFTRLSEEADSRAGELCDKSS